MRFHAKVLSASQKTVLRQAGPALSAGGFYLGGGTAVALQLGHRRSEDLDWLSQKPLTDPLAWATRLKAAGVAFSEPVVGKGALHGRAAGVRISLLHYQYPLLDPLVEWPAHGRMASLADLACMKLLALVQRGAKKDFLDLYALGLKFRPLPGLLRLCQEKFAIRDPSRFLAALTYFDDADPEPNPKLFWKTGWPEVRKTLSEWVRQVR